MRILLIAISLLIAFGGCYRYTPPMKWELSTRIDRTCYHQCKTKHHVCMAWRTERSSSNCDRAEEWCVQTCADPVGVKVPDYEKIRLLEKCGAPTPGVSEEIFWDWCRKGLL
jgi:hypothetical protein